MLLRNTFTDGGLVNDAQGTVKGIEWGDETQIILRGVCSVVALANDLE